MVLKKCFSYACKPKTALAEAQTGLMAFLKELSTKGLTPIKVYMALSKLPGMNLCEWEMNFAEGLEKVIGTRIPALTAVVQPPVDNSPLLAEVWCVEDSVPCHFLRIENLPHVLMEKDGLRELWTSGFFSENFEAAFEKLTRTLESQGFSYDDIFRQWNYVGNILEEHSVEGKTVQNYQHFNDIRAVYYRKKQDRSQYPAATGIGMSQSGLCIDAVAVKTSADFAGKNLPIKSPVQKDAYRYDDKYLVGESTVLPTKNAPLFERGRSLLSKGSGIAMISGTASIKGEETIDQDNIGKQTENTLQFTKELLRDYPNAQCQRARLYVKRDQNPDEAVRIFKAAFPKTCVCTGVFADVCRNNLLIEIESDWQL